MTWLRMFRDFTLWQVIMLVAIGVAYSQVSPFCLKYESHYCACSPDEQPKLMTVKMCLYHTTKGYICHTCPIYLQDQSFCEECFGMTCPVCFQNISDSKGLYNRMHSYIRNSSGVGKQPVKILAKFPKSSNEKGNANYANDSIIPERKYLKNAKQGYHQNEIFEREKIKSSTIPVDNSGKYIYDDLVQRNRSDGHVIIRIRDTDVRVKRSFIETNENVTEVVKKATKDLISDASYMNSSNVKLTTGSGMKNLGYNINGGESKNSNVQQPHTIKFPDEEWSSKNTRKQPEVREKDNEEIKKVPTHMNKHEVKMDRSQNLSQNLIVKKLDNKHDVESKTHTISVKSNPEIHHEVSFENSENMKLKQEAKNESALQEEFPKYVSANIYNSNPHNKNVENVLNVKESNGTKNIQLISEFDNTDYTTVENGDESKSFHKLHGEVSTEDHVHKKKYTAKVSESNASDKQISLNKSSKEKCKTKMILNAYGKKYLFPTYNFRCEIYSRSNHSVLNTTGSKKYLYPFDKKNLFPLLREIMKCLNATDENYSVIDSKIEVVISNCPFTSLPEILTTVMHTYVNLNDNNAQDTSSPVSVLHEVSVKLTDSFYLRINAFTKHTVSRNSSDDNLTKVPSNDTGKLLVIKGQLRINITLSLINSYPDESETNLPPLKPKLPFLYRRNPSNSDMLKYSFLSSKANFLKKTLMGNPKLSLNSSRIFGHTAKELKAKDEIISLYNRKLSINVNEVNFPIIHVHPMLVLLNYNQKTSLNSLLMNHSRYDIRKDNGNEYQNEFQRANGINFYNLEDNSSAGDEEVFKYSLRSNGTKNYYLLHPEEKNPGKTLWTRKESKSETPSMRFSTRRPLENSNKKNEEPDSLIIRLRGNDNASNSKSQEVIIRRKRQMPQNDWCPINSMRRYGNMECIVWSYKKVCKLECHPGYGVYGKSEESFNCKRKDGVWTPGSIVSCTEQRGGERLLSVPPPIPEVNQIIPKPDEDSKPEDTNENDEDNAQYGEFYDPEDYPEELDDTEQEDKVLEGDYEYEEEALTEEAFDYDSI